MKVMNLAYHGIAFRREDGVLVTLLLRCVVKSTFLFAICISVRILRIRRCELTSYKRFLEAHVAIVYVVIRHCVLLERL